MSPDACRFGEFFHLTPLHPPLPSGAMTKHLQLLLFSPLERNSWGMKTNKGGMLPVPPPNFGGNPY
ncbi:MAG: hypothetical protein F6K36_08620 [Symploca sp. SIO3C6]|nr:hypothetical protein [Symploca sp. SIO3C6]NET05617.1 hypothetical protein [Symploca sp. SIO2B6]